MQSLISLLAVLVWPAVAVALIHYAINYIDKVLKLREPLSDKNFNELKDDLKKLKSDINSIRINKGMTNEQ